ncbi:TPA: small, acid-soluble spore protein, alpha/beta type [Bacillus cereus]|nr:small, acid-soluble spore protein, alpha/beta type [Bacillus cereus]
MANNNSGSRNELLIRDAESEIDQMKYKIAQNFNIQLDGRFTR